MCMKAPYTFFPFTVLFEVRSYPLYLCKRSLHNSKMNIFYSALSIVWLVFNTSHAQTEKLRFEHITVDQGLPDNAALCSMQDSKGFVWFGTWNGLCKYDGYTFTTYQFDPHDTSSIGGNVITRIFEDHDGIIWVIAGIGIYLFDRTTEKFTRFNPKSDFLSPSYSHSWELNEDKEGKIWTGNDEDGQLVRYDKQTGKLDDYTSKMFPKQDSNAKKEDRAINLYIRTSMVPYG
jgi:ligand-binding sensor domain-containing protein